MVIRRNCILANLNAITKTRLYNFDPLKPHFYIVKLGFTGVYIIFLFLLKNINCGYSLEPPRRGSSNEYPQSMFWAEIWKISEFLSENFQFLEVKFFIYLYRRVFVMGFNIFSDMDLNIYGFSTCWWTDERTGEGMGKWTDVRPDPYVAPVSLSRCHKRITVFTVWIRTDRPEQIVQTQMRGRGTRPLFWVYTVCHSSSNFRHNIG